MEMKKEKMHDFVQIPRKAYQNSFEGEVNHKDLHVLWWLYMGANPTRASINISYSQLEVEMKGFLNRTYLRKILKKLKDLGYIWFEQRQGQRGPFTIYINEYHTSRGKVSQIEEVKKIKGYTKSQPEDPIHKGFGNASPEKPYQNIKPEEVDFTTFYNDTDKLTDKENNGVEKLQSTLPELYEKILKKTSVDDNQF